MVARIWQGGEAHGLLRLCAVAKLVFVLVIGVSTFASFIHRERECGIEFK